MIDMNEPNNSTADIVRNAIDYLKKHQIPPEPCGCVKYSPYVTVACEKHADSLDELVDRYERSRGKRLGHHGSNSE